MLFTCFLVFCQFFFAFCQSPEDSVIKSGVPWYDTNGKEIHAHGGGFYYEKTTKRYYWFGTTQKTQPDWLSSGINVYSSVDLSHWKFENVVFMNTSIKISTPGPYRIERPKVLYNQKTNKFVMWFHLDTAEFSIQLVGVAVSSTLTGKYEFVSGFKPDGLASYDMTLYEDDDGKAYLCRSVQNSYAGISQLTDDYLNTTGIISKGPKIEGQAIWKMDNYYYLLGSHLTGWSANQAVLCKSDSTKLSGTTWTELKVITTSPTTYSSQSTYVLPYAHPNGKMLYIYMGDRWDYPTVNLASYIWLPLVVHSPTDITLPWLESWTIKDY